MQGLFLFLECPSRVPFECPF